jgi:hypothetical protein
MLIYRTLGEKSEEINSLLKRGGLYIGDTSREPSKVSGNIVFLSSLEVSPICISNS